MTAIPNLSEGAKCPDCDGRLHYRKVVGCSCHINPPCSACVDNPLVCDTCNEEIEREEPPPPTQTQLDSWAKYREDYEAARQRGHTFPNGGRIFNMRSDGSSGSTMVWSGHYEGEVTAAQIYEYFGDGTFGHRGPTLYGKSFSYTKITD